MGKTLSFGKGKGSIRHNNREYITENVDRDRVSNNVYFVQEDIRDAYEKCFGDAIADYNAKQKRKDRQKTVDGYMDEIRKNQANKNGEKLFYEQVVGIGDMYDSGILNAPEDAKKCADILTEYAKEFQHRNPNLYVFNMVLHMDEQTPHLHIDYIPIAHGYKQGLQARNSLSKGLEEMGIESGKSKADNATMHWQERERGYITEIAREHGVEIDYLGVKRADMTLDQYKTMARENEQRLNTIARTDAPQMVKLPFNLALVKNKEQMDNYIERKVGVKATRQHYDEAIQKADNVVERSRASVVRIEDAITNAERAEEKYNAKALEAEQTKAEYEKAMANNEVVQLQKDISMLMDKAFNAEKETRKQIEMNKSLEKQVEYYQDRYNELKDNYDEHVDKAVREKTKDYAELQHEVHQLKLERQELCDSLKAVRKCIGDLEISIEEKFKRNGLYEFIDDKLKKFKYSYSQELEKMVETIRNIGRGIRPKKEQEHEYENEYSR